MNEMNSDGGTAYGHDRQLLLEVVVVVIVALVVTELSPFCYPLVLPTW